MWLKEIQLKNIKSFSDSGAIQLSKGINVLVGANSAGKSILLRSAYQLQGPQNDPNPGAFLQSAARHGTTEQEVRLLLADPNHKQLPCIPPTYDLANWRPEFVFTRKNNQTSVTMRKNNPGNDFVGAQIPTCHQKEPDNFIYPYFSRRKPNSFDLGINLANETVVEETFAHLPAKVDRLSTPRHHGFKPFEQTSLECLQFQVSTVTHANGKAVGLVVGDGTLLPIEQMGEGTPGILALLSHLCVAKGKLFLIEEPENDIHPRALKALLDFMVAKSQDNQFIVSTHSNIVLRILGGAPGAHVFSIQMSLDPTHQIPTSTCTLLDGEPESRARLLEDLGYAPSDLYLYDAYLVLEESTAERVLRDFIVPYMYPKLQGKLRMVAAGGVTKVEPCFDDFHRLFVFLHVTPQYRNRAWVAIDGGTDGEGVISKLQKKFESWPPDHFRCFKATTFESYYPPQFRPEADRVLRLPNSPARTKEKGRLAEAVVAWCIEHPQEAKDWFAQEAKDLVGLIGEIEKTLNTKT